MGLTQNLGVVSPVPMGQWQSSSNGIPVTYDKLNMVTNNGNTYIAKTTNSGIEPGVASNWQTYWMVLSPSLGDITTAFSEEFANAVDNFESEFTTSVQKNTNNIKALFNLQIDKSVLVYENAEMTAKIQQTGGTDLSGLTVLDNSYATVNKISGNTVASKNLFGFYMPQGSYSFGGVTLSQDGYGNFTLSGTATRSGYISLVVQGNVDGAINVPDYLKGKTILCYAYGGNLQGGYVAFGGSGIGQSNSNVSEGFLIPENSTTLWVRFQFSEGITYNTNLNVMFVEGETRDASTEYQPYFSGLKNAQISGIESINRNIVNPMDIANFCIQTLPTRFSMKTFDGKNCLAYFLTSSGAPKFYFPTGAHGFRCRMYSDGSYNRSIFSINGISGNVLWGTRNDVENVDSYAIVKPNEWVDYSFYSNEEFSYINFYSEASNYIYIEIDSIMTEISTTPTPFEKYFSSSMTLPQNVELGKWDYIENGQLVVGTETLTFDGTENWQLAWADDNSYFWFYLDLTKPSNGANITVNNKFNGNVDMTNSNIYVNGSSLIVSSGIASQYTTVESWKSYLASQSSAETPLIVAYKLASSTTTSLSFDNQYLVWNNGIENILTPTDESGNTCFDYGANTTEENSYYVIAGGTN